MAVRKVKGGYRADWRDGRGERQRATFRLKEDAVAHERRELERAAAIRRGDAPPLAGDPDTTLEDYALKVYLPSRPALGIAPGTIAWQRSTLETHVLPELGHLRLKGIHRSDVRAFLVGKLAATSIHGRPFATNYVRAMRTTVSGVLTEAVEAGLIAANPCRGVWKELQRGRSRKLKGATKALDTQQAAAFAEAAQQSEPESWPAFALMMLAGLRPMEALALQRESIDFAGARLTVDMSLSTSFGVPSALRPPKDGEARTVDLAAPLVALLRQLVEGRPSARVVRYDGAALGARKPGPFLFDQSLPANPSGRQALALHSRTTDAMRRALKVAGLPLRFSLHSLRHTYGSGLVSRGVPIVYVQQQMGHANISMTVDVYGSWLPVRAPGAVATFAAELLGSRGHLVDTLAVGAEGNPLRLNHLRANPDIPPD